MTRVTLTVNGAAVSREVEARAHLADFLREDLNLTGVHIGCEHGVCGACTVMVDGAPQRSCITYAAASEGADVRTIEDFDDDPVMAALRDAFSERHGLQCGYCTPGVLATAYDVVTRLPGADAARVREELAGNLCRCTGYAGMVQAIVDVAADPPAPAAPKRPAAVAFPSPAALPESAPAPKAASIQAAGGAVDLGPDAAEIRLDRALDLSVDAAWRVLSDVETAARCLPGASLTAYDPATGRAEGHFAVAIGPMKATFAGVAETRFDAGARTGGFAGRSQDAQSRTSAEGDVSFALTPEGDGASRLAVVARYRIGGPFAQFSRGAVVEAAARALMADF
ncbi:MAG: 2Fe-2S iron-sulfur cluster-binding protein, partial [Alphaproteobacteria bacterium]